MTVRTYSPSSSGPARSSPELPYAAGPRLHGYGRQCAKAQRLEQGSDIGWGITVRPDRDADVMVVLPVTTDCDDASAICTQDGRMLSHRKELTVSAPGG